MADDERPPTLEEATKNHKETVETLRGNVVALPPQQPEEEIGGRAQAVKALDKYYCRGTINGKFFIINERISNKISFMTRNDFIYSLESERVHITTTNPKGDIGAKYEPVSKIWLESKSDREFDELVFDCALPPGLHNRKYNLWRGFYTEAHQGNCSLTLAYIKEIISYNDESVYNWVLNYIAHMVQKPWEKPEIALVLVGLKGVGKTFFMDIVQMLIDGKDRHYHCFKTSNANDIYGDYREQLRNLVALLLEEVTWGGDIRHIGTLNDLITGKTITINIKHGPILTVNNIIRVIMGGNPGWKVPASYDERRYMILNVSNARQQDHVYFSAINDELVAGGYAALMYELMHRDISKFNYREALVTEALIDQKIESLPAVEGWWLGILREGKMKFIDSESDNWISVSNHILYNEYWKFMKRISSRQRILRKDEFGIELRRLIPKVEDGNVVLNKDGRRVISLIRDKRSGKERIHSSVMPPLNICRELMDFRLKRKLDWSEEEQWELPESDEL